MISQKTWDAVQAQLAANTHANRSQSNAKSASLLAGLIFDANGNRLVSSHATKNGKRYHYYITTDGPGRTVPSSNAVKLRLPAAQIEDLVLSTLARFLNDKQQIAKFLRKRRSRTADLQSALELAGHLADVLGSGSAIRKRELVAGLLARVTAGEAAIKLSLKAEQIRAWILNTSKPSENSAKEPDIALEAQFIAPTRDKATKLLIEQPGDFRSGPDPVVVKAIARAQSWFDQLVSGKAQTMAEIATRENVTDNYISNLIHMAWLPPRQVDAILDSDMEAIRLAKNSMLSRAVNIVW